MQKGSSVPSLPKNEQFSWEATATSSLGACRNGWAASGPSTSAVPPWLSSPSASPAQGEESGVHSWLQEKALSPLRLVNETSQNI